MIWTLILTSFFSCASFSAEPQVDAKEFAEFKSLVAELGTKLEVARAGQRSQAEARKVLLTGYLSKYSVYQAAENKRLGRMTLEESAQIEAILKDALQICPSIPVQEPSPTQASR